MHPVKTINSKLRSITYCLLACKMHTYHNHIYYSAGLLIKCIRYYSCCFAGTKKKIYIWYMVDVDVILS